jgi:hypothetical protein
MWRLVELRVPRTGWTPSFVPYSADQTVYLVIDRFGGVGTETEAETTIDRYLLLPASGPNSAVTVAQSRSRSPALTTSMAS